ncbi:hypothetical protein F5887DRAFT_1016221 [Amanita rubescens]|nr:hypothetical protein F5887DRAFT_1016221 [Amanita rubescens]
MIVKYAADGMLPTSPGGEVKEALNALCRYWVSLKDRIMDQMVVWEGGAPSTARRLTVPHLDPAHGKNVYDYSYQLGHSKNNVTRHWSKPTSQQTHGHQTQRGRIS